MLLNQFVLLFATVLCRTGYGFLSTVTSNLELFNSQLILNVVEPKILQVIENSVDGTECGADLNRLITHVFKFKLWALRMLDASGKLNSGLLYGNYHLTGSYDECVSIETDVDGKTIQGQYCTVSLNFQENQMKSIFNFVQMVAKEAGGVKSFNWEIFKNQFTPFYGLCIPQSCSAENLNRLWTYIETEYRIPFNATFLEDSCFYKEKPIRSNKVDFYIFLFFAVVLTIVLGSTVYDIHSRKFGKEPNIFVSFSLQTNIEKLSSTNCEKDNLTCLYGIRVLSMTWVIITHCAMAKLLTSLTNTLYTLEWKEGLESVIPTSGPYAVDTFFSISGLLVVYDFPKQSKKSVLAFYLSRALRLMPALLATILIYISVLKYVGEGPNWALHLKKFAIECEDYWWSTLFFISNFHSAQCLQQSWYLSVDSQLHAIAPLILWGIKKNPTKTFSCILAACLLSSIYTYFVVIQNHLGFVPYIDLTEIQLDQVYYSTISRMPSWLIGTFLGYLLNQCNSKKVTISRMVNCCLWLISLSTMLTLVMYHIVFTRDDFEVSRSAFFNAFSRSLWSLAVCYIIFSCSTGHGGFVNTFLSHPVFIVLSKLTYTAYLIHAAIIYLVLFNKNQPSYCSNFEVFCDVWIIVGITLVCSTIIYLIFETPVISIQKHLERAKLAKEKTS